MLVSSPHSNDSNAKDGIMKETNTLKCRYNAVQFIAILHTALRYQWQKVNQILLSQQTSHISPSQASYGMSIVRIVEKIDRVIANQ